MALLALHGPGIELHWRKGRWTVTRAGEEIRRLRPKDVDEIQCEGAVLVEPGARAAALARGVPVVFLTADGRYRGRLEGPRGPAGANQVAQARWLSDPDRRLGLAQTLVQGKLGTARALLISRQRRVRSESVAAAAAALRVLSERVKEAKSLDAVRGFEGEGARRYFAAFGELIQGGPFAWTGRSRRPPRDPVNACLSYRYTALAARVEDAVRTVGVLPGIGALHEVGPGKQPLVYDLVEEFRAPLVDRLVLRLVNRRQLAPEDFEDPAWRRPTLPAAGRSEPVGLRGSGAVYLGPSARRLVTREFARGLRGDLLDADDGASVQARWLLERQARRVAALFRGEADAYRPFDWGVR